MKFKAGASGNPLGRPKGVKDHRRRRRSELRAIIDGRIDGVLGKVLALAEAGDLVAARLVLERVLPALKPESEVEAVKVKGSSLVETGNSILAATLAGQLPTDMGRQLAQTLVALARVEELTELRARLEKLEEHFEKHHQTD